MPVLLFYVCRYSYYDEVIYLINKILEDSTYLGIKFTVSGGLISYLDIARLLSLSIPALLLALPYLVVLGYIDNIRFLYRNEVVKYWWLVRLPMTLWVSMHITFFALEVTSGNTFGNFEYDPKLVDFVEDFVVILISVVIFVHTRVYSSTTLLTSILIPIWVLVLITFISSGTFKVSRVLIPASYLIYRRVLLVKLIPYSNRWIVFG